MTTYNGETFDNMHSEMHAEDSFEDCTFQGAASRCNFYKAQFDQDCVFEAGFKFMNSNLQQAAGVEGVPMEGCLYITDADWQEKIQLERIRNPCLQLDP